MQGVLGFHTGIFVRGGRGEEHLGDLSKRFDMGGGGGGGRQACLINIMTSEIQKVSANELVLNKFQLSKIELLRL